MPQALAPSLLAADPLFLERAIRDCEAAQVDALHYDVMDGHFVPNLSFGVPLLKRLAEATRLPLDVHLMVRRPENCVPWYLDAGASRLSVHLEAVEHGHRCLASIRERGVEAGIALNPHTPVAALSDLLLDVCDFVLLMSVNPGFGGQRYLPGFERKIEELRDRLTAYAARSGRRPQIAIDGGVHQGNIAAVVAAGAEFVVAGSSVFGGPSVVEAVRSLRHEMTGMRC